MANPPKSLAYPLKPTARRIQFDPCRPRTAT
jgi:hypothetical protein